MNDPRLQPAGGDESNTILASRGHVAVGGMATIVGVDLEVVRALDDIFASWSRDRGGIGVQAPALVPVVDLEMIDYFQNFPHLGMAAVSLDLATAPIVVEAGCLANSHLSSTDAFIPSAACYSIYAGVNGARLEHPMLRTLEAMCCRREEHYQGLQRLLSFHMREIVHVGTAKTARQHLDDLRTPIADLLEALGVPFKIEAAQDPFYDGESSRAALQMLDPVKYEYVAYGETAIASLNIHRNFFGERFDIRMEETGDLAHTSCVAFGLERWLWALDRRFDGDMHAALGALGDAAAGES